ncbi:MAG TPA: dethiobiotin synthase [Sandaracinaceae bacterium LLY-WYZ-13_1]|nr:dethiobiotin synthase [Sandaracinaceae bacterium LLY-WYZ-13_1]
MTRLFVTATGTEVGKTWLTRGLAAALRARGRRVAAIKPLETGCRPDPSDALALAEACGRPELANAPGLYRAERPLAPYAANLAGESAPDLDALVDATRALADDAEVALVEGAGGLLVPLDATRTIADLVAALGTPVVLVARDRLGVLSHTLTAFESAERRGIDVRAVVLSCSPEASDEDPSPRSNRRILAERLPTPVLPYPRSDGRTASLARAADPLLAPLGLV